MVSLKRLKTKKITYLLCKRLPVIPISIDLCKLTRKLLNFFSGRVQCQVTYWRWSNCCWSTTVITGWGSKAFFIIHQWYLRQCRQIGGRSWGRRFCWWWFRCRWWFWSLNAEQVDLIVVVLCLEMEVEEEKTIPVSKAFLYDSDTDAHAHTHWHDWSAVLLLYRTVQWVQHSITLCRCTRHCR